MKRTRRILVTILSAAMLLSMMTGIALAEEIDPAEQLTVGEGYDEVVQDVIVDPEEVGDNDEMLEAYMEVHVATNHEPMRAVNSVGKRLSGVDLTAYNILKEKAVLIAAGEIPDAQFTFGATELGLKESYSAADLGVISLGTTTTGITAEAQTAIWNLFPDLDQVVTALLFDCPYAFYWYDKATQGACGMSMGYFYSYNSSGTITSILDLECVISFSVAQEYADEEGRCYEDSYGDLHPITVDSTKTTAVRIALENIIDIIEGNAYLDDYEKLKAYKDTIDDLVDYNHPAADNDDTPYGNPWQLIWVFDDDPNTTVVCEGYSKAFQFLCDLSEFESPYVESRIVTGMMSGGTGEGPHMWNVLTMGNRSNYLVDVTNCDYGSIGYSDCLFLVGGGTGSVSSGYSIAIPSQSTIKYTYDSNTLNAYDASELTLATDSYTYTKPADEEVRIASAQVGLKDQILVRFNLVLNANSPDDYTVEYTLKGETYEESLADLPTDEKGRYGVIVPVVAKEMTEPIVIWVKDENDSIVSNQIKYSVETFCLNKIKNDKCEKDLKDLCAAILNYGAYAQIKLNYKIDDLANRSLEGHEQYSTGVPNVTIQPPQIASLVGGVTDGITIKSATLGLEGATVIRFTFALESGEDIGNYTFTCGEKILTPVFAGTVDGKANYWVYIRGIAAKNMHKDYTVIVCKGNEGPLSVTYSVLTYLYNKSIAGDTPLQNLCKVMYFYHTKAKDYFTYH